MGTTVAAPHSPRNERVNHEKRTQSCPHDRVDTSIQEQPQGSPACRQASSTARGRGQINGLRSKPVARSIPPHARSDHSRRPDARYSCEGRFELPGLHHLNPRAFTHNLFCQLPFVARALVRHDVAILSIFCLAPHSRHSPCRGSVTSRTSATGRHRRELVAVPPESPRDRANVTVAPTPRAYCGASGGPGHDGFNE